MVMISSRPSEVQWDYGDGVTKNPIIENDKRYLRRIFNPATYLLSNARSSNPGDESTFSSPSRATDTLSSNPSTFRVLSVDEDPEEEVFAQQCMSFCMTRTMRVDLEQECHDKRDDTSPNSLSTGCCYSKKGMGPNGDPDVATKSDELHPQGGVRLMKESSMGSHHSMLGKSIHIPHQSLLSHPDLFFDARDDVTILRTPRDLVVIEKDLKDGHVDERWQRSMSGKAGMCFSTVGGGLRYDDVNMIHEEITCLGGGDESCDLCKKNMVPKNGIPQPTRPHSTYQRGKDASHDNSFNFTKHSDQNERKTILEDVQKQEKVHSHWMDKFTTKVRLCFLCVSLKNESDNEKSNPILKPKVSKTHKLKMMQASLKQICKHCAKALAEKTFEGCKDTKCILEQVYDGRKAT